MARMKFMILSLNQFNLSSKVHSFYVRPVIDNEVCIVLPVSSQVSVHEADEPKGDTGDGDKQ